MRRWKHGTIPKMEIRIPFPGLDPWLEMFWDDVHQRTMTYIADTLQEQLRDGLRARLRERAFFLKGSSETYIIESVVEIENMKADSALVTAIESLSPANKQSGPGMEK